MVVQRYPVKSTALLGDDVGVDQTIGRTLGQGRRLVVAVERRNVVQQEDELALENGVRRLGARSFVQGHQSDHHLLNPPQLAVVELTEFVVGHGLAFLCGVCHVLNIT